MWYIENFTDFPGEIQSNHAFNQIEIWARTLIQMIY